MHIYAGQLFGDQLTDTPVSGRTPDMDDDVTYGLRYEYNFSEAWGLELSLGETPTKVGRLEGDDIDLNLTALDIDAIWHFGSGAPIAGYLVGGVGYAQADLDQEITGVADGQEVSIDDDGGYTVNAGIGGKWFLGDRFLIRLEARYRYLSAVVDRFEDPLNTYEATLGFGLKF